MTAGRGRVVVEEVESRVLAGNPLGDSPVRRVPVYLPPSYDAEPDRRYPVVFFLVGFTGKSLTPLNVDPWQPNLPERLDALIAGGMGELIVVVPDCFTRYGGSQYINSPAVGRYEDHVVQELVPWMDARFRTRPDRRGVLGKSSGGYGALVLAMRHPEAFHAVACHSGDMYFEYCYKPDFPRALNAFQRAGGPETWWRRFLEKPKKSGEDFPALNTLAMAACYSPNPEAPLGVDWPFDLETGRLREEVWARWLEHDPVYLVDRYADALRRLRLLYLDCGTRDEFNLHFGARIFARRLQELGIPYEHQEFDDGHGGTSYRYDVSFPRLARALEA